MLLRVAAGWRGRGHRLRGGAAGLRSCRCCHGSPAYRRVARGGRLGIAGVVEQILPATLIEAGRILVANLQRRRIESAGKSLELVRAIALTDIDGGERHPALVEQG